MRRGAVHADGQRKTGNSGDGHNLGSLVPLGFPHCKTPLFRTGETAIDQAHFSVSEALYCAAFGQRAQGLFELTRAYPMLEAPVYGLVWRIFVGRLRYWAAVRRIHNTPFKIAHVTAGGFRARQSAAETAAAGPAEPNPHPRPHRVLAFVVTQNLCRHLLRAAICMKFLSQKTISTIHQTALCR